MNLLQLGTNRIHCYSRTVPWTHWLSSSFRTQYTTPPTSHAIQNALKCLKLTDHPSTRNDLTMKRLRGAYFQAAKQCHPDSSSTCQSMTDDELTQQFLQITEAYEFLQANLGSINNGSKKDEASSSRSNNCFQDEQVVDYISRSEEEHYRLSCREVLGLDAETVEESKRCPLFREWLKGRTDAAFHWNTFLMIHGGLAPMLNTHPRKQIGEGSKRVKRRRRKP